jgi:hypothetical protein
MRTTKRSRSKNAEGSKRARSKNAEGSKIEHESDYADSSALRRCCEDVQRLALRLGLRRRSSHARCVAR